MYELVYEADGRPQRYKLTGGVVSLGRSSENEVVLNDFSVSRKHAVLRRSEEHTSELQSQSNLVCRLLLEKKKKDAYPLALNAKSPVSVRAARADNIALLSCRSYTT